MLGISGGLGSSVLLDVVYRTYIARPAHEQADGGSEHPRKDKVWHAIRVAYVEVAGAFSGVRALCHWTVRALIRTSRWRIRRSPYATPSRGTRVWSLSHCAWRMRLILRGGCAQAKRPHETSSSISAQKARPLRRFPHLLSLTFLRVASRTGSTRSTGSARFAPALPRPPANTHGRPERTHDAYPRAPPVHRARDALLAPRAWYLAHVAFNIACFVHRAGRRFQRPANAPGGVAPARSWSHTLEWGVAWRGARAAPAARCWHEGMRSVGVVAQCAGCR
jgi:hypothetical protein